MGHGHTLTSFPASLPLPNQTEAQRNLRRGTGRDGAALKIIC